MRKGDADIYVCPATGGALTLVVDEARGDEIVRGALVSAAGVRYAIEAGIPDLTYPLTLAPADAAARSDYDRNAPVYDQYLPLTFSTFGVDEVAVRNSMIDDLALKPS